MTDELAWLSVAEGRRRLAAGTLTSQDWVKGLVHRTERLNPELHACLSLRDTAHVEAERADHERGQNRSVGPLHGVPIGVKDVVDVAGMPTTGHSAVLPGDRLASADAELVRRLRAAGAIMLTKHAQYELCYGGPSFDLPWPPARNPWNLERIPGGSSSGSAAAVSAGLCPAAIGTDSGGSIRQPSAYCGITGLKPSAGLVPLDGVVPVSFSLDAAGPMARSAEDCALILDVIAGTSTHGALDCNLKGLRIGILPDVFNGSIVVAKEVVDALVSALNVFRDGGAQVREVDAPSLFDADACGRIVLLAEAFAFHEAALRRQASLYGKIGRHRFALGGLLSAADYAHALDLRTALTEKMDRLFDTVDVLVTAGEVTEAPDFETASPSFGFTSQPSLRMPFTVCGNPAIVVPCGVGRDGLPLSMQIIGRHGNDAAVLSVAAAYQGLTDWHTRRPIL